MKKRVRRLKTKTETQTKLNNTRLKIKINWKNARPRRFENKGVQGYQRKYRANKFEV